MLDLAKIQTLAATATPQELFAVLMWQQRFNSFDGSAIVTDLVNGSHLWKSFLFSRPVYGPDPDGGSFLGVMDLLMGMANYRKVPEESVIGFISYPGDTLYLLAENQDTIVAQLVALGKKWNADYITLYTQDKVETLDYPNTDDNELDDIWFRTYVLSTLRRMTINGLQDCIEAVIIGYWWD